MISYEADTGCALQKRCSEKFHRKMPASPATLLRREPGTSVFLFYVTLPVAAFNMINTAHFKNCSTGSHQKYRLLDKKSVFLKLFLAASSS